MSAQYCDLPNQISKLIVLHAKIQKRDITVVLRHTCIILSFGFTSCCFQIDRRDRSGKTPQQIHDRR